MRVILLQDVKKIGKKGEIKDVSVGYARNFLLPEKLAEIATPTAVAKIEAQDNKAKQQEDERKNVLSKKASELNGKSIIIKAKAKDGKLFGSIWKREISNAIKKEGLEVDEKSIETDHIKEIGEKEVRIVFDYGFSAKVKVVVEAE